MIINILNGNAVLTNEDGTVVEELFNVKSMHIYDSFINQINEYADICKYTFGQTLAIDICAILATIYKKGIENKNLRVLELGSLYGCSSIFIGKAIKMFNEDNILICMNTWKKEDEEQKHNIANYIDPLTYFKNIVGYYDLSNNIKPFVCDSIQGMKVLKDNYFDVIFIDTANNYKNVYEDISNAIRLVKPNGVILGHNCECKCEELPLNVQNKLLLEEDTNMIDLYHTGVIKALKDIFKDEYTHFSNSLIWYKYIYEEDKLSYYERNNSNINKINDILKTLYYEVDSFINKSIQKDNDDGLLVIIDCFTKVADILNNNFELVKNKELKSNTLILKDYFISIIAGKAIKKENMEYYKEKIIKLYSTWIRIIETEMNLN